MQQNETSPTAFDGSPMSPEMKAACEAVCLIQSGKDGDGCECTQLWGPNAATRCPCEEIAKAAIAAYEQAKWKAVLNAQR